ncbi:MAG TPA: GHMP kinase [Thermoplasmata archaeon]|nr:GHMP kinase [Thermoplasmata archaeon]
MEILRAKAPLRISFAGGGTDVDPYPEERGGAVLNATIDKYAYATLLARSGEGHAKVHSLDFDVDAEYRAPQDFVFTGELDLVKAVLRYFHRDDAEFEIFLHSDAPPRTGLGSSSTLTVALTGLFQRYLRLPLTPYELAELAYQIERVELGDPGGRQDQYAATFGGFNFIEFTKNATVVNPLRIHPEVMNELAYRLMLCYTGVTRYSGKIIESQTNAYRAKRSETVQALDRTKQLALDMKKELLTGNLDAMGRLLHDSWEEKKRFTDGISNPGIDKFYEEARAAGALGGKLTGAGGGGYLLLFCDFRRRQDVAKAVTRAGGRIVDFAFCHEGVQTWSVRSSANGEGEAVRAPS